MLPGRVDGCACPGAWATGSNGRATTRARGGTVDLGGGTGFGSDAEGGTLSGIEFLWGSAFVGTLSGDNGVNMIRGGASNDILEGHGGADIFVFGAGDVILLTGIGFGLVTFDLFDFV